MTSDGALVPTLLQSSSRADEDNHSEVITEVDHCAVMILDIRGSTKQLSRPSYGPGQAASRVHSMLTFVNTILAKDKPKFLKSTGDGFFCVWELDANHLHEEQLRILKAASQVNSDLPPKLLGGNLGLSGEIGVGLTFGTLACYTNGVINDYFGYFANLAAKLQDQARPHGLIVDAAPLSVWPRPLREQLPELGLKSHPISKSSPLYDFQVTHCYATASVELAHNWTCLAWPGFATAEVDSDSGYDRQSCGLHTRGITVITHEGLQGKIGTLAISRAFQSKSQSEHFQIFIDDYDALTLLHEQNQVNLKAVEGRLNHIKRRLSGALTGTCSECNFTFIPVRCGVNGLAANGCFPWNLGGFETYGALLDKIEQAVDGDLSLDEVALYENVGATLPILVMAANPDLNSRNVLTAANKDTLERTRDRLKTIVQKRRQYFSRYRKIEDLAIALGKGTIKLVIGGGAWLVPSGPSLGEELTFSVPSTSGAFLWIEGAALHNDASDAGALVEFLSDSVLSKEFQDRLPSVLPYPACPCASESIKAILFGPAPDGTSERYVAEETKRAFEKADRLQRNISIRRAPAKDREVWAEIFTEILGDCCVPNS
jgi:class 3 adenylate cyclase